MKHFTYHECYEVTATKLAIDPHTDESQFALPALQKTGKERLDVGKLELNVFDEIDFTPWGVLELTALSGSCSNCRTLIFQQVRIIPD